jgi:hypothetical protein
MILKASIFCSKQVFCEKPWCSCKMLIGLDVGLASKVSRTIIRGFPCSVSTSHARKHVIHFFFNLEDDGIDTLEQQCI